MKISFDASKVEPNLGYSLLPAGRYPVKVESIDMRDNKASEGKHFALQLAIADGQYKGRKLFHNLNLWNKSPEAVAIAKGTLSALCHAAGVLQLEDTDQLVGATVVADVGISTAQGIYGKQNSVNTFFGTDAVGSLEVPGLVAEADDVLCI